MGERDREFGTAGGAWGNRLAADEFRDWLDRIHREAREHSERIRERSRIPQWLLR